MTNSNHSDLHRLIAVGACTEAEWVVKHVMVILEGFRLLETNVSYTDSKPIQTVS